MLGDRLKNSFCEIPGIPKGIPFASEQSLPFTNLKTKNFL